MKRFIALFAVLSVLVGLLGCSRLEQPVGPTTTEPGKPSVSALAVAGLSSADDPVFGPGSVTIDPNSGLEWLNLALSTDLPWDYVESQFGPGGQFEGWRHATVVEVTQLFTDAGIPDLAAGFTLANYEPVKGLLGFIGITVPAVPVLESSLGFTGTPVPDYPDFIYLGRLNVDLTTKKAFADPIGTRAPIKTHIYTIGHFLVRSAKTPEQMIEDIIVKVQALIGNELKEGQANGLITPLRNALRSLQGEMTAPACSQMTDFINEVGLKTPPLSESTSASLIAAAQAVRNDLGCN